MRFLLASTLMLAALVPTAADPPTGLPPLIPGMDAERAVRLSDGDWLVYRYGTRSDSGVELLRMDSVMTKRRWRAECKCLEVPHSKYYHKADVDIKNNEAIVTSIANNGHGGCFEERLDLATGQQTARTQKLPGEVEK
jgi:hypothetical protein